MKKPPDKWTSDEKAGEIMDYVEAKQNDVWKIERKLADDIIESLTRNGVVDVFKIDKLTKGEGNCFMIATMQQLRREEVYEKSRPEVREIAASMNHRCLRRSVYDWLMEHLTHPKIKRMRELYNLDQDVKKDLGEESKTWDAYWNDMLKDGIWADNWFVQASALFLEMDIWIMDTTCTKKNPYFQVDGNLEVDGYCSETLYLGLAHETHYQSLILVDDMEVAVNPKDKEDLRDSKMKYGQQDEEMKHEDEMDYIENIQEEDNKYEVAKDGMEQDSQNEDMSDEELGMDEKKCPICKKQLKNVLLHIKKAKYCLSRIGNDKLKALEIRSKMIRKEKVIKNKISKLKSEYLKT